MEDHHLSAVRYYLSSIFASTRISESRLLHPQPENAPCRNENKVVRIIFGPKEQEDAENCIMRIFIMLYCSPHIIKVGLVVHVARMMRNVYEISVAEN
jgi:hypothetical protein